MPAAFVLTELAVMSSYFADNQRAKLLQAQAQLMQYAAGLGVAVGAIRALIDGTKQPQGKGEELLYNIACRLGLIQQAQAPIETRSQTPAAIEARESLQAVAAKTDKRLNDVVKMPATLAAEMMRRKDYAALTAWLLARAEDVNGQGWIDKKVLQKRAAQLGIEKRSLQRLIKAAKDAEIITESKTENTKHALFYRAPDVLSMMYNTALNGRWVYVPMEDINTLPKLKAALLGAWHKGRNKRNDRPISQQTIQRETGITPKSQQRYNKRMKTRVKRNIAKSDILTQGRKANAEAREMYPGAFVLFDKFTRKKLLGWHLPNDYESTYRRGARVRVRRKYADKSCSLTASGELSEENYKRIFFEEAKMLDKAAHKERSKVKPSARDFYINTKRKTRKGARLWYLSDTVKANNSF